jgi:leader peptidase (prepilin peptidase)/N-methyltransferase
VPVDFSYQPVELFLVVALGLCFGSFATALAWRLPRDISIVKKERSSCPSCGHDLGARDLVPVLSWLLLRGKCRFCKASIGARYPAMELATVALCLAYYAAFGFGWPVLGIYMTAPVIIAMADIDFRHKIIPDGLNLALGLCGFLVLMCMAAIDGNPPDFVLTYGGEAVAGVLVYGLVSLALRQIFMVVLKREPMGLGDIKFFAAAGVWLGLSPDAVAVFMIVSGATGILVALFWRKLSGEEEFPFGPSLIVAFVTTIFLHHPAFLINM